MSDTYAGQAIIRWDDHGQVHVLWELQGAAYGMSVAPEMFDEMLLGDVDGLENAPTGPVVMQLMVFDD